MVVVVVAAEGRGEEAATDLVSSPGWEAAGQAQWQEEAAADAVLSAG